MIDPRRILRYGMFRIRGCAAADGTQGASRLDGEYAPMKFKHTHRPGFLLGLIDFFMAGLFFLVYMRLGLQDELEYILGHRVMPYWKAYLLGIPTLFIYPLIWMAGIAEELKAKAADLGIPGPHTSWRHMFGWNIFGLPLMGPAVATMRFFDTLNRVEDRINANDS